MTFWTDPTLEPKRNYKFILSMPGGTSTTGIQEFLVKGVGKPSFSINPATHDFLNHKFYYPGKPVWESISATIVDTTDPSLNATQAIMKVLEESGYDLPTTPTVTTGFGTLSKDKAVNAALGQVKIKTLDSNGAIVEEWVLNNAFLIKAEFGSLDYSNEELTAITIGIQYDNAYINVINGEGRIPATSG